MELPNNFTATVGSPPIAKGKRNKLLNGWREILGLDFLYKVLFTTLPFNAPCRYSDNKPCVGLQQIHTMSVLHFFRRRTREKNGLFLLIEIVGGESAWLASGAAAKSPRNALSAWRISPAYLFL